MRGGARPGPWLLGLALALLGPAGCGGDEGGPVVDAAATVVDAAAGGDGGASAGDGGGGDGALGADAALVGCGCATFTAPASVGRVMGAGAELSGIAASRKHRGLLYVHNDDPISGDTNLYVIDERAAVVGTITLTGAQANNLEDLAVGPCGGGAPGSCVFVGNIGDNAGNASEHQIHRFTEPDVVIGPTTLTPITLRYDYPGGAHPDAESLVVDPAGEIYVLTKVAGRSEVFHVPASAPLPPLTRVTALRVGELALPAGQVATGADLAPCGARLLLRTYGGLHEWRAATPGWPALLAAPRGTLPVATEAQGEAVGWTGSGGYATISEGASPHLNLSACQ
ncbi:MAG: hypothetical protein IT370_20455 [Deltaproteobacteria bacterium]|nr:hypothetical protein [Deltaproteobacteria bacterium]